MRGSRRLLRAGVLLAAQHAAWMMALGLVASVALTSSGLVLQVRMCGRVLSAAAASTAAASTASTATRPMPAALMKIFYGF